MVNLGAKYFRKKCGVYKISFDDNFYIGSSNDIGNRLRVHRSRINRYLKDETTQTAGWYSNMIPYLRNNPLAKVKVEVLLLCNQKDLLDEEWAIVRKETTNKKCFNIPYIP